MNATEIAPQVAAMRSYWNAFAEQYTKTLNHRVTKQCALQMHSSLKLEQAESVLEVAAGAGVGSLDVLEYLKRGASQNNTKRRFVVTDFSPIMVKLATRNLKAAATSAELVDVKIREADGQNLVRIKSGSMDRYVASLCLQLCPDPDALLREARRVLKIDGMAGFTIWGRPEFSGLFTIMAAVSKEMGYDDGSESSYFAMGKDLAALRERFVAAGFSNTVIWPLLCVLELSSGKDFADFVEETFHDGDGEFDERRYEVTRRLADEWLAQGFPIGLETYIITAKA